MDITQNANHRGDGVSRYSDYFWKGYRAFVYGGRVYATPFAGRVVVKDSSMEPFDDFTESQKRDWREGVAYARKEREELSVFKSKTFKLEEIRVRRISAIADLKNGMTPQEVMLKYRISRPTVYSYMRAINIKNKVSRRKLYS